MAKNRKSIHKDSSSTLVSEILSAILFTVGLFSFLSLIFYSSESTYDLKNTMGAIGVFISGTLGHSFGVVSFFIPFAMFYSAYVVFTNKLRMAQLAKTLFAIVFVLSLTTIVGLTFKGSLLGYDPAGGLVGSFLSLRIKDSFAGTLGSYIIVAVFLLMSLMLITEYKLSYLFALLKGVTVNFIKAAYGLTIKKIPELLSDGTKVKNKPQTLQSKKEQPVISFSRGDEVEKDVSGEDGEESSSPKIVLELDSDAPKQDGSPDQDEEAPSPWKKDFELPSPELLDISDETEIKVDDEFKEFIERESRLIEDKLKDFKISGKVTEVRPGPVITMFEYKPAPGVKISKISSLSHDLAMGLSALSVRIIAPIPGKNVIGIEVPNQEREVVMIRDLIESPEFMDKHSVLTLALGKDISGKPFYTDLRRAPHLMIAGTTGSGKSVLLNAILASLVYKLTPRELKFIMIDPKMLELSIYEGIPHLLHPVVTEPVKAAAALKWAVREMENRYQLLSEEGVRDLETYNKKIETEDPENELDRWMPYIVIVIDELADLMMIAPSEIKESITRLSQKARAAGIHLVVATQRPSADIVAGLLKANFPSRISFHVSSKIDSRIILDTGGAENLLGKGDMLYWKPGASSLIRLQGALISDRERERITEHLKTQGQPEYNENITYVEDSEENAEFDEEKDELYNTALRVVLEKRQASVSMLQRRLNIGYNRAANIIEMMEREGVVGPQESAGKPREVYMDINQIEGLSN